MNTEHNNMNTLLILLLNTAGITEYEIFTCIYSVPVEIDHKSSLQRFVRKSPFTC